MLTHLIGYFFINLCGLYSYLKILALKLSKKKFGTLLSITAVLIPSLSYMFSRYNNALGIAIMFLFCYLFLTLITKSKAYLSFMCLLLSYGLSFVFLIFSSALITIISLLIYKSYNFIPYKYVFVPTGIIQFVCISFITNNKRFHNGILLLIQNKLVSLGALISISFMVYTSFSSANLNPDIIPRTIVTLIVLPLSIFLIYYWSHRITQTYKEKLRLANEKSLQDELNRQKQEIATLQADNERLAKIVHKDNKLIPAMELTVTEFLLNSPSLNVDELSALGQELSERFHNMAKDRQGILQSGQKADIALPQSGLHTVDGMLSFMETRAKEEQITYKIQVDENIKSLITDTIQEEDLLHLLGDLIDNAIIAVKHCQINKEILIHLGTLQNHFLLEISDSGVPFDVESYQHFGNEQHTTHKEHGGSGIGLMDIWKLKKKYKASLQIYEYLPNTSVYTKKISFVFDRKNHFLLQTYRYKEVTYTLTRGDLYVFPYKTE